MAVDRKRVLLVDDDPYHLEIYGMLMKEGGYEPVPALVWSTGVALPVRLGCFDHPLRLQPEFQSDYG